MKSTAKKLKNNVKSCKSRQASLQFALERERRRLVNCQERERMETENELKTSRGKAQRCDHCFFQGEGQCKFSMSLDVSGSKVPKCQKTYLLFNAAGKVHVK